LTLVYIVLPRSCNHRLHHSNTNNEQLWLYCHFVIEICILLAAPAVQVQLEMSSGQNVLKNSRPINDGAPIIPQQQAIVKQLGSCFATS
jgi:low temperature requirement protein LtrA